ncbi:DUF3987 domain-containing protein [Microvirga lenta]|uniref:DUF3987 domain-containing protein n=1 Tax=Microvirga lenta TaxID=2881337 RepID=UPI001CFFDBA5|nr:DUF3987 domain-containing protein [Microvirga lenta]MCB5176886.1 DUF3987 domain-containing protein [Microvirga lenta]
MIQDIKHLVRMGASVILLRPRSKQPIGKDWSKKPRASLEELKASYRPGYNVGIRLGEKSVIDGRFLHVIDVDIRNPDLADEAFARLEALFKGYKVWSWPCVLSGSGGESRHFYFMTDKAFRGKKLARSENKVPGTNKQEWEIELFGTGKQVALPPSIHPNGGTYRWEVEIDPTAELPCVEVEFLKDLTGQGDEEDEDAAGGEMEPLDVTYEEVEEWLGDLDPDWCDDRPKWIRVGMAISYNFGKCDRAYQLWRRFSMQMPDRWDEEDGRRNWKSFNHKTQRPVTLRTIIAESKKSRRKAELMADIEDLEELDGPKPLTRAEKRAWVDGLEPIPGEKPKEEPVKPRATDPDLTILRQARYDAPDFPLHIFSKFWQHEIEALANNGAAPIDYAAAGIMAVAGSTIGNSRVVEVRSGWREPPVVWCQIIGPPSANKSPALRPLIKMLDILEASWEPEFQDAHRRWQSDKKKADTLRKQWEQQMVAALEKGEDVGPMSPECKAPPEPTKRRAYVTDTTLEAMIRVLAGNERGLLNYRDEMTGWLTNMSRYGGNGASDRPAWLEAYGGGTYVVDRVKDDGKPVRVPRFSVCILGGIQPDPLINMVQGTDDGLQARFIPFWPEDTFRPFNRGKIIESRALGAFERISELNMRRDKKTGLREPVPVPFTEKAVDVFEEWTNRRKLSEKHAPTKLQGAYGKAEGQVARVALILEILKWAEDLFDDDVLGPSEIGADSVRKAIEFRESYIKPMQMRVFGHGAASEEAQLAKGIAQWIVSNEIEEFKVRDLRREGGIPGISGRTDKERVEEAVLYLVALRWLNVIDRTSKKGGRPTQVYEVNPRLWELLDK